MSKFCIDLEGMMMTDAIAAVVEAWLDAQNVEASSPQNTETYEPGDLIEVRDTTVLHESWCNGFVFFKAMSTKVGVCLAEKWNFEEKKPQYLVDGGHYRYIFHNYKESGCCLKMPKNIRRYHSEETIQDAGSAVLQVLQEASDRGVSSISRGELVAEITRRFRFAPKTIDNTLTRMVGARKPDICRVSRPRGHYKLSPRFLALSPNRIPPNGYVIAARQHKQQRRKVK
jgi:hypothetical protein